MQLSISHALPLKKEPPNEKHMYDKVILWLCFETYYIKPDDMSVDAILLYAFVYG
jgi:hypothetical protein